MKTSDSDDGSMAWIVERRISTDPERWLIVGEYDDEETISYIVANLEKQGQTTRTIPAKRWLLYVGSAAAVTSYGSEKEARAAHDRFTFLGIRSTIIRP